MIKAVIFDMDGVLVDADKWHYNALNVALQHADVDPISWQEHLTVYKGIPTREKLRILTERKGLDPELWELVSKTKQDVTQQIIESFSTPDGEKIEMLRLLSRRYPIVVCSNSIRSTVDVMLDGAGLSEYIDFTLSNEDVQRLEARPRGLLRGVRAARAAAGGVRDHRGLRRRQGRGDRRRRACSARSTTRPTSTTTASCARSATPTASTS